MIGIDIEQHATKDEHILRRFLEFVDRHPEYAQPTDLSGVPCDYPVQSWPIFIGSDRLAEFERATTAVFRLLRTIPERIFDNDGARIGAYYGINPRGLAPALFSEPDGLDFAIGRGDFLEGESGFKCVELNPYGSLGGLETEFMFETFRHTSPYARFVAESGIEPEFGRCMLTLFQYMIRVARERGIAGNEINVAAIADGARPAFGAYGDLSEVCYQEALSRIGGVGGRLVRCEQHEVVRRGDDLYCGDTRLHVVWDYAVLKHYPPRFVMAFKRGRVVYFNSPAAGYLGCKRSLALLSQALETDRYDGGDREAIERYVPWARELADREVTYQGSRHRLPDLLRDHRTGFVLKKGQSYGGEDVHIGQNTAAEEWDRILEDGLAEGTWLAQEFIEPRRFLCQSGGDGLAMCKAVWGGFCFGDSFGGAYLRIFPGARTGPINSARGAMTGLIFRT